MHGLGNDFVVIDAISQNVDMTPALAQAIAERRFGIGCDQILLVEPAGEPDVEFNYRIFNQDGSEVSQCGNGARCFAKYVSSKGLTQKTNFSVLTRSGKLGLVLEESGLVTVDMGQPTFVPSEIPFIADQAADNYSIEIDSETISVSVLSMGNPHAVLKVENVDQAPVDRIGQCLQNHQRFPEQVNVGFMQVLNRSSFKLRVFERGVGETLACGSGACAAMVAGVKLNLIDSTATAHLPGGELELSWAGQGCAVYKTGPAEFVYDGIWLAAP